MKCPVRATTRAVYVGTFQIDGATDLRGATQRKDISKRKMPVTIGVKWGKEALDELGYLQMDDLTAQATKDFKNR